MRRVRAVAVTLIAVGVALAGCAAAKPGVGVWQLADSASVDATTVSLEIEVTRFECSGGETGEVLEPVVAYETHRIIIRSDVAPLPDGVYGCPDNDSVAVVVELSEPLGERELVDAACLDSGAASTIFCEDGGVRWRPPA